jgi:adenylate cyclase
VNSFEEVTVLFPDLVGFTSLTTQTAPSALIQLLDQVFSAFDELADLHGVEKIKTTGDAYMAAAGVPFPHRDHAFAAARMSLGMHAAMERFNRKSGAKLQMRIGICTGPVIAGIIGQKKFIYDLWGDTVNLASRTESHGAPGKTQVTATTYQFCVIASASRSAATSTLRERAP